MTEPSSEHAPEPSPADAEEPAPHGVRARVSSRFAGTRGLVRIVHRDPEHLAERLTLVAAERLGEPSRQWAAEVRAARPDDHPAVIAEEQRLVTAKISRIDGAIAGTPFFIALVPAYVGYLWQEARMTLRIAALHGNDPRELRTAAETLALRGVHPTVAAAEAELAVVRETPLPPRPEERRPLATWIRSVRQLLVFGGFISASDGPREKTWKARLELAGGILAGLVMWVVTWVLPLTFMVAMAWGCETHARQLGRRAMALYGGGAETTDAAIAAAKRPDEGHDLRQLLRAGALGLSVILPIGFIAYADHIRNKTGVNGLGALGALVALSLVLAVTVASRR